MEGGGERRERNCAFCVVGKERDKRKKEVKGDMGEGGVECEGSFWLRDILVENLRKEVRGVERK